MPVANPQAAVDEILAIFKAAWDAAPGGPYAIIYPDVELTSAQKALLESGSAPWARPNILHTSSEQATLAGYTGQQRFESIGVLTVEIYAPSGRGLQLARSLGTLVRDAYRKADTASGVWFFRHRIREIGPEGHWVHFNVTVEFSYDEVK